MLIAIPIILGILLTAMWLMRTDRTRQCRWRQSSRVEEGTIWTCAVCGAKSETDGGEPKFCGAP